MSTNNESSNIKQHSKEWLDDRLGMITSSAGSVLMSPPKQFKPSVTIKEKIDWLIKRGKSEELQALAESLKKDLSKFKNDDFKDVYDNTPPEIIDDLTPGALTYIRRKVAERLTGWREEETFSRPTDWGNTYEPVAKQEFAEFLGIKILDMPFVMYGEFCGGSPDGKLETETHLVEFKCPYVPGNHLANFDLITPEDLLKEHADYYWQNIFNMCFTGVPKCYHVSFDPRQKGKLRMTHLELTLTPEIKDRAWFKIKQAEQRFKEELLRFNSL